jgi:hypothetical protein
MGLLAAYPEARFMRQKRPICVKRDLPMGLLAAYPEAQAAHGDALEKMLKSQRPSPFVQWRHCMLTFQNFYQLKLIHCEIVVSVKEVEHVL